jgi:hypothetical protein
MDQSMLSNLIRRQPSFRIATKKRGANSIVLSDLGPTRQGSARRDGFDSFVSVRDDQHHLDPLSETGDDSLPELFSYLPDENPGAEYSSDDNSVDLSMALGEMSVKSSRSDGGKFNESSITGFGLTWEETQALKKLASITKEMMDLDVDDDDDLDLDTPFASAKFKASAGGTPSWKSKDSKEMRDLPREIEFDDDSESEDESPRKEATPATKFQKPKDIGGELDFEDSDSEDESPNFAPTPMRQKTVSIQKEKNFRITKKDTAVRPEVKRRNTCGTLYVGTTMSAPDKDATIKVGSFDSAQTKNNPFSCSWSQTFVLLFSVRLWSTPKPHSFFRAGHGI